MGDVDVLLGYAGYRLMRSPPRPARTVALGAWAATLLGVGGFSWVLFGRKRTDEALGVNAAMVGTSVALVASAAKADRPPPSRSCPWRPGFCSPACCRKSFGGETANRVGPTRCRGRRANTALWSSDR